MAPSDIAQYVAWVQIGLAVLVVLFALLAAVRAARPHYVRGSALIAPALTVVAVIAASALGGFGLSLTATGIAVIAGAAVGFFAGRGAKYGEYQGKRAVKPMPLIAWVNALSIALLALGVALIGPNTASLLAAVAMGAAAMAMAESVAHLAGSRAVVR